MRMVTLTLGPDGILRPKDGFDPVLWARISRDGKCVIDAPPDVIAAELMRLATEGRGPCEMVNTHRLDSETWAIASTDVTPPFH